MSGNTTELNLKTAVDADDTADYLTLSLADSLRTVDALFNNVSGHNHSGAHQGGPFGTGSIPGSAIADGAITSAKIADGSITGGDIADGQITSSKLAANIAITGTLSVGGASTFTGVVNASSILMTPTGVIRMGPAAAQQSGGLNLANGNPVSWRNATNTADLSMIIDSNNDWSFVGWRGDGTPCALSGSSAMSIRIVFNGAPYRIPLIAGY